MQHKRVMDTMSSILRVGSIRLLTVKIGWGGGTLFPKGNKVYLHRKLFSADMERTYRF